MPYPLIIVPFLLAAGTPTPPTSPADVGQISSSTAQIDAQPMLLIEPRIPDGEQLTSGSARVDVGQPLGSKVSPDAPLQQLTPGKATVEAGPSLSRRDQSRPPPSEPLGGKDRCDPAAKTSRPTNLCGHVIESRSAEFDRRPTALTPEQKLLLEQRVGRDTSSQATARRLAGGAPEELSSEDQAIASVALRPIVQPATPKEEDQKAPLSPEQAAVIVGTILNQPPR